MTMNVCWEEDCEADPFRKCIYFENIDLSKLSSGRNNNKEECDDDSLSAKILTSMPLFTRNMLISDNSKPQSSSPSSRIGSHFSPNAYDFSIVLEESAEAQHSYVSKSSASVKKDSYLTITPLLTQRPSSANLASFEKGESVTTNKSATEETNVKEVVFQRKGVSCSEQCTLAALELERQRQFFNTIEHCYKHERSVVEALHRYENCFPSELSTLDIPPMGTNLEHIEKNNTNCINQNHVIRNWHNKVSELYELSVRKSVLEYALLSELFLSRLRLKEAEPLLEHSKMEYDRWKDPLYVCIPQSWKSRFKLHKKTIAKRLLRCDGSMVALRNTWMNIFENRMALKLGAELESLFPMQLKDFKQMQMQHIEQLKSTLLTQWIPKALDIIQTRTSKVDDVVYLRCVNALQDVQKKELMQQSIQSFLEILLKINAQEHKLDASNIQYQTVNPFLLVEITCQGTFPVLKPTLEDCKATLFNVIDKCWEVICYTPTLSAAHTNNTETERLSTKEDLPKDILCSNVKAKKILGEILEESYKKPIDVCSLFEDCASYIMDPELISEAKKSGDITLQRVEERLIAVRKHKKQLITLCQSEIPAGLIMISTRGIKDQIKSRARDFENTCFERLKVKMEADCNILVEAFEEHGRFLEKETITNEDLLQTHIQKAVVYVEENKENLRSILKRLDVLVQYRCPISDWLLDLVVQVVFWPSKFHIANISKGLTTCQCGETNTSMNGH